MEGNIFKGREELIRRKTGRENTDKCEYKTKDPSTPYPVSTMTISRWLEMSKSRTNFRYFLLILPQSPIIVSSGISRNGACFCTSVGFSSETSYKLLNPHQNPLARGFTNLLPTAWRTISFFCSELCSSWLYLRSPTSCTGRDILSHVCPSQVCRSLSCSPQVISF